MALFELDTPEDLACRGFGQKEILFLTGVDTGYHTNGLRVKTKGVDRLAYKREHVLTRVADDVVKSILSRYGNGSLSFEDALAELGLSNPSICKFKKLFSGTRWESVFADADRHRRKANMQRGFAKAHGGVDNPFKLQEYQDKAADTREAKYGGRYTLSSGSSKSEAARATFATHMEDDRFREAVDTKRRATTIKNYGVEHPMESDEIKHRVRDTMVERYGVAHWSKTETARSMQSERVHEHGAEWAAKSRETCLKRYGVENWSKTEEARAAQSKRMRESSDERFEKMHKTMLERYGVAWGGQTEKHHEIMHHIWSERREELIERIREGNIKKYGVPYYLQTDEARAAQSEKMLSDGKRRAEIAKATCLEKYGVEHWIQVPGNAKKIHDRIIENGSFGVSLNELFFREVLVSRFGENDVEFQFSLDERYPFACDFYIRSRDLFIELNGTWTHGGHWFDVYNNSDVARAEFWRNKNTKYYQNAVDNWCERDVRKREAARLANLNYVVLWDGSQDFADGRLWLAMGCPDGHDWEHEYSWLPERDVRFFVEQPALSDTPTAATRVAKWANGHVFYTRELRVWAENPYLPKWGTLQAWLYANRFKYMCSHSDECWQGKTPNELSDVEILRGLGISGLVRAYSSFDSSAMREIILKYDIKSVLDPCAGWGERMVTCIQTGVDYVGLDVNDALAEGYSRIVEAFGDAERHVFRIVEDSATTDIDGEFDAVITCPPYGGLEVYSDVGAENLDADLFAKWWSDVVSNVGSQARRFFCVQTNHACRNVFASGCETNGWKLLESVALRKRASHMTRDREGVVRKREFEEMLVFEHA